MKEEQGVKKAIPMIMLVFISSATMINVFNIIAPRLTVDFGIDSSTVSLLSMIAMLMMGVSSVVYSTLSDYISIRKLMIFGICLLNVGAVLAFLAAGYNFYCLIASAAVMIAGGTCGSGLMIITVTRYIREEEHARYYGFNTACVSISQALGVLLGGFFATFIGWRFGLLIPLISLISLPVLCKYIPDEKKQEKGRLDVVGLGLLTSFTLLLSLYFNLGSLGLFVTAAAVLALFLLYISKSRNAFIDIGFFKNRRFVTIIVLVALAFGIQSAFAFLFSFMAQGVHGIPLNRVSMLLLPSYAIAALIALNSGKIVKRFGSFRLLCTALLMSGFALAVGAVAMDKSIVVLGICACLFSGGYAMVYAPFMQIVVSTLAPEQIGAGIGFFNLMTSIGPSLMIVLTGKMMTAEAMTRQIGIVKDTAALFSNILFVFMAVLAVVIISLAFNKKTFGLKGECAK